ncbi:MAG: ABC transporter ATP-binding protein, partial [Calditrichaeota bacterium]
MNIYLRILRYVRKYWLHLGGSLICIIFFTLFSSASLVSIIPFLKVIFQQEMSAAPSPAASPEQLAPPKLAGGLTHKIDQFKVMLEQWVLATERVVALEKLCLLILILIFFKGLFGYLQSYYMAFVEQGVMMDIRNDLYRHISRLDLAFFQSRRTGELISKITNDVNMINN